MGASSSSPGGDNCASSHFDDTASPSSSTVPVVWLLLKAQTTNRESRKVSNRSWRIRASTSGVTLGGAALVTGPASASATESAAVTWISRPAPLSIRAPLAATQPDGRTDRIVTVDDVAILPEHLTIALRPSERGSTAALSFNCPGGRAYFQVSAGSQPLPIERDTVIKFGACSLQVSDLCSGLETPEERRAAFLQTRAGGQPPSTTPIREGTRDDSCYICFETGDGEGGVDPIIPSPCICAKAVHRSCLQRWIMTRQTRTCSICRGSLPLDMTVTSPFAVLTVVRHVRGLHWQGQKEYVATFASRSPPGLRPLLVGSGDICDVCVRDPSVSTVHARLSYSSADASGGQGVFTLENINSSSTGTFVRIPPARPFLLPLPTVPVAPASVSSPLVYVFKVARTVITLTVQIAPSNAPPALPNVLTATLASGAAALANAIRRPLGFGLSMGGAAPSAHASITQLNRLAVTAQPSPNGAPRAAPLADDPAGPVMEDSISGAIEVAAVDDSVDDDNTGAIVGLGGTLVWVGEGVRDVPPPRGSAGNLSSEG